MLLLFIMSLNRTIKITIDIMNSKNMADTIHVGILLQKTRKSE
jgi:hypothetical protein